MISLSYLYTFFLQRFLKLDFMGHLQMEKLKSNRQFVDELSLSLHKALSEILSRLGQLEVYYIMFFLFLCLT